METKLTIMSEFFKDPQKAFGIRELSRRVRINHDTVRQYLNKLVKEGLIKKRKETTFSTFTSNITPQYLNFKLYYNLEKLRKSEFIDLLKKEFDFPTIVLFGSYVKARDTKDSDIDICIITNIKKELQLKHYEFLLNRKIGLHFYTKHEFQNLKQKNPELINSFANGIVLEGELEII